MLPSIELHDFFCRLTTATAKLRSGRPRRRQDLTARPLRKRARRVSECSSFYFLSKNFVTIPPRGTGLGITAHSAEPTFEHATINTTPLFLPEQLVVIAPSCDLESQPWTGQQTPVAPSQEVGSDRTTTYPLAAGTLLEMAYLPSDRIAYGSALAWASSAAATPEDFAFGLTNQGMVTSEQHYQESPMTERAQKGYRPLITDDKNIDEPGGEILYGIGLYNSPDHNKGLAAHGDVGTGRGLGLKLEDAWKPPAGGCVEQTSAFPPITWLLSGEQLDFLPLQGTTFKTRFHLRHVAVRATSTVFGEPTS